METENGFYTIKRLGELADYFRELRQQARRCAKSSKKSNLPAIPPRTYLHDLKPRWEEENAEFIQNKLKKLIDFIRECEVEEPLAPPPYLVAWVEEHILPTKTVVDAPRLSDDGIVR